MASICPFSSQLPPRRRQSAINAGAVISEIAVEEARRVDRQYGSSRRRRRPEVRPTTSSGQRHAHPRQFYTFAHDDIDADEEEEEEEDNTEQVEEDDLGPDDDKEDEAFRRAVNLFPRRTNLNNNSIAEEFRGPIVREQQGGGLHPIAAGPLGATPAIRAAAQVGMMGSVVVVVVVMQHIFSNNITHDSAPTTQHQLMAARTNR